MKLRPVIILVLLTGFTLTGMSANEPKRKAALDQLLKILPESEAWVQWLDETAELPPDFDALPSIPYLPDPLLMKNGRKVTNQNQWNQQRNELQVLIQHYITGSIPPPPGNVKVQKEESRKEGNLTISDITLSFGPDNQATLDLHLIVPAGKPPFPVFLTQENHYGWALIAAGRGYIGCVYAGADVKDDTGPYAELWPEEDWTKLTRRAWAASRCIDYLETLDFVDTSKICLTGHSRNGKLSLIGGCLDERITAVISSSSGAGGACTYRLFSETHFGEGIELLTRVFPDWMHPRLRFFAGRENKLPIDQNSLIACIAPRACLLSTAYNDSVESVWAIEHTYRSARRVYELLGEQDALQLRYRWGSHETQTQDIEAYLDWLDEKFKYRASVFEESAPLFPTYDEWQLQFGGFIDPSKFPEKGMGDLLLDEKNQVIQTQEQWQKKAQEIRDRLHWVLGKEPPVGAVHTGKYGTEYTYLSSLLNRSQASKGITKSQCNFGNYIAGDLYYPQKAEQGKQKIPAIIWLHGMNPARGYVPSYRRGTPPHLRLAQAGFAVLAYDQIGNGYRLEEITNFYHRYPHWTLMGKMIRDVRSAVEVFNQYSFIDTNRIYIVGYDMGAKVGLHAAALDDRIAGVVSVAGFTPMRFDVADRGTGGIARWSKWFPLLPKLGAFEGHEKRIPYDYHELLALIAPRPVLVVAPTLDLQATPNDIKACVIAAKEVYKLLGAENQLQLLEIEDYNRFSPELQSAFLTAWKKQIQ